MLCADYSTEFLLDSVPGLKTAKDKLEERLKKKGDNIKEPGLLLILLDDDPGGQVWRSWHRRNAEYERINKDYVLVMSQGGISACIVFDLDPLHYRRDYILKTYRERGYLTLTEAEKSTDDENPENWEEIIELILQHRDRTDDLIEAMKS